MEGLFDSTTARMLAGLVVAVFSLVAIYSTHAYWFFTRIDFGNIAFQMVLFTRHDNWADGHGEDFVVLEDVGRTTSLHQLVGNRWSFWFVILSSWRVTVQQPVLNFGKHAERILVRIRREVTSSQSGMVFKRAAGFPCRLDNYQLALVYDRSEDRSTYVVKGVLVKNADINNFERYRKPRPMNAGNYQFVQKIVTAFRTHQGSFISVRVTTA